MSAPRRRKPQTRSTPARSKPRRKQAPSRDFWGHEDVDEGGGDGGTIRTIPDSTALIRSLGPPPLPGYETAAEHYFAAVFDKAAQLAVALAAASGLLATDEQDD
jgi:hypothetical protein